MTDAELQAIQDEWDEIVRLTSGNWMPMRPAKVQATVLALLADNRRLRDALAEAAPLIEQQERRMDAWRFGRRPDGTPERAIPLHAAEDDE